MFEKLSLADRVRALREFVSTPPSRAIFPDQIQLLIEVERALSNLPPQSAVEVPWPLLPGGSRISVSGYTRSQVVDYGKEKAAERDSFWADRVAHNAKLEEHLEAVLSLLIDRSNQFNDSEHEILAEARAALKP